MLRHLKCNESPGFFCKLENVSEKNFLSSDLKNLECLGLHHWLFSFVDPAASRRRHHWLFFFVDPVILNITKSAARRT